MTEKVEWEVVDEAEPTSRPMRQPWEALLGPWWRWKVACIALGTTVALVFFATAAAIILLVMATGVILTVGVRWLGQWLRNGRDSARL